MDEKILWKIIRKKSKPSYQTVVDYNKNKKPINNVANKGLKEGEIAVRGAGEYNGFSIKALENIKPLLTDYRVSKAVKLLSQGNIQGASIVLRINDKVQAEGLGFLYGVLKLWLERNGIDIPNEYIKKANEIKSVETLEWLNLMTYSSIMGKFEIVNIGYGKGGTPVVPESWLGRVFNNADELHKEMDTLEWRKGKPPVNYCCIYAMHIKKIKSWESISEITSELNVRVGVTIFPKIENNKLINLNSDTYFFNKKKDYVDWLKTLPKNGKVLSSVLANGEPGERILLCCDIDKIIKKIPVYEKTKNVGLLVSTLQKLIRRGRGCSKILDDTLTKLWKSPNYNLPEQQFLRVSAGRQLTWRVYITALEDVQPFENDNDNANNDINNKTYLSMLDFACLATLANMYPDAQFTDIIFDHILYTTLLLQHNDKLGSKWNMLTVDLEEFTNDIINTNIPNDNSFLKSCKLLSWYMPGRGGDHEMIARSFNYVNTKYKLKPLEKLSMKQLLSFADEKIAHAGELAGYDMAPSPNILIQLQSSFPFIPYDEKHTTKGLSGFIWNNSSSINIRLPVKELKNEEEVKVLGILKKIQDNSLFSSYRLKIDDIIENSRKFKNEIIEIKHKIPDQVSRLGFLLLFGQKISINYQKKRYEIVVAGNEEEPCKVKIITKDKSEFLEGYERFIAEIGYVEYISNNKIIIELPDPPKGYQWIWPDKSKLILGAKLIKSDKQKMQNKIKFIVNDYELEPFNTSPLLKIIPMIKYIKPIDSIGEIINQALYFPGNYKFDDYEINLIMRKLSEYLLPTFQWFERAKESKIPAIVWKCMIVKFLNNYNNEIQIGPVDGGGNKLRDSISYLYEGTLLRMFNMLSMLYPYILIPKTALSFYINAKANGYSDLLDKLNELAFLNMNLKNINKNIPAKTKILTKLWNHQEKTSDKILHDIIKLNKTGFGDASDVGSGKTLTALSIISGLYNHNYTNKDFHYSGFLILLPTTYLYKTWQDEIIKHVEGFDVITQNANGTLTGEIKMNTILITTLGRMREHPISQPWIFVIIDECLSVQNKNALQTEEAYRQIICSQYKVFLLSATFFRSRFDKLFYMLKMLNSGLPENKTYLDTILAEHIVSNIPKKKTEWKTNINRFALPLSLRNQYDIILKQELNSEKLYIKLQSFLYDNFDYVKAFSKVIRHAENAGRRCLIYAKSKNEADLFSEEIKNVTRFPDISGKHTVLSYTEGTYGLNQLVIFNTIVTRVPNPDIIPQVRGRVDRPLQTSETLYLEYIVIENTLDEASLFRLELANSFFNNYILPLADFYDIAVGKKKKSSIKIGKSK